MQKKMILLLNQENKKVCLILMNFKMKSVESQYHHWPIFRSNQVFMNKNQLKIKNI